MGSCVSQIPDYSNIAPSELLDYSDFNHKNLIRLIDKTPLHFSTVEPNGLPFMYNLIIHTPFYARSKLVELANIVYQNRHKFGNVGARISCANFVKILIIDNRLICYNLANERTQVTHHADEMYYAINGISALDLCFYLRRYMVTRFQLADNYDIIIDLLCKMLNNQIIVTRDDSIHINNQTTEAKTETNTDFSCVICLDNMREIMLRPCNHLCVCNICVSSIIADSKCPMCRQTVVASEYVYL